MVSANMLLGAALGVTASLVSNVAILIQKHAADVESHKPWSQRWRFWSGFVLNVFSQVVIFSAALALAPLSWLAPLSGLTVVFNALLARFGCVCGVRETLSWSDWACTLLIFAGILLASIAGPGTAPPAPPLTVADLQATFANGLYIGYFCVGTAAVVVFLLLWKQSCSEALGRWRPREDTLLASVLSGCTAAFCGSVSVVSLKVVVAAVGELSGGATPAAVLGEPMVWAALVGLCSFAPLQLFLLNMTLGSGTATFTIPLYLSLTMILVSVSGGVLFHEFASMAGRGAFYIAGYAAGVALIIGGLAVLSYRQERKGRLQAAAEAEGRQDVQLIRAPAAGADRSEEEVEGSEHADSPDADTEMV